MFCLALVAILSYAMLVVVMFYSQRSFLYFPSHVDSPTRLTPWLNTNRTIGYCREVPRPKTIWLMMHGNAGQAADRDYVLSLLSEEDSLYVLEYPGYGSREGKPSLQSINQAATEAYRILRSNHPDTPVCLLGESLGSGPACSLARENPPPDKVVLVVPFDSLENVAAKRFFFLPVRLLFLDKWDNVEALRGYSGPVEIYGAENDKIIAIGHAETLARQVSDAHFTRIPGGHNEWCMGEKSVILNMD